MYGGEVPAYNTLVDVTAQVNDEILGRDAEAQRLGSIERVTAERHGAIRLGTAHELRQVAQIFAGFGMHPVGFYDLREAAATAVPVISTAFRPLDVDELAKNPFRVFTSLLTTADRRFFSPDLQSRLETYLARRELFTPELLELARLAEAEGALPEQDAERFLTLAVAAFALSPEPVERGWYAELERVSAVAADIGGVTSTHINHLTPRVLDIDLLYERMQTRGIAMIDEIQGPPRWDGPVVLLRQTSFRALAEPRTFREADGSLTTGCLRVRFGEVEARGVALSPAGRGRYDELMVETDRQLLEQPGASRQDVARQLWQDGFPQDERELLAAELAYFTYQPGANRPTGRPPPQRSSLTALIDDGWLIADPIVYEDFLPRSAAGIFRSNLADEGSRDSGQSGIDYDDNWLADAMERPVHDPYDLYAAQQEASLRHVMRALR
jgi:uncharacterized glyoxalase superfamily metalloenzyme YdcJ